MRTIISHRQTYRYSLHFFYQFVSLERVLAICTVRSSLSYRQLASVLCS